MLKIKHLRAGAKPLKRVDSKYKKAFKKDNTSHKPNSVFWHIRIRQNDNHLSSSDIAIGIKRATFCPEYSGLCSCTRQGLPSFAVTGKEEM